MTEYNLASFITVCGTWKLHLYAADAGLTVPSINTVLEIGETRESANISVGVSEIGNVKMSLRDDDSTYSQGFWYKVLQGETSLRIYLDEGSGDTFYFWGTVEQLSVRWEERYIGATRIRTVSFTLLSAMRKLLDSTVDNFITDVLANCTATGEAASVGVPSHIMKVTELFACMLSASGLNPDYNPATDISFLSGSQAELQWGDGVSLYNLSQIYVPVKYTVSTGPTVTASIAYFDTTKTTCLARQLDGSGFYENMQAFLKDLLPTFGLLMRTAYDSATERHQIQLMHKHDVYSGTLNFNSREKTSQISNGSRLLGDSARATDLLDDTKFIWASLKYAKYSSPLAPQSGISFDFDYRCPFIINAAASGEGNHSILVWAGAGNPIVYTTGLKFYSTISGLMTQDTTNYHQQGASVLYLYEWFTNYHATIWRGYGKMLADAGGGDTHTVLQTMRRTSINDLDSTRTFFANTMSKNPMTSEVSVEWIEE